MRQRYTHLIVVVIIIFSREKVGVFLLGFLHGDQPLRLCSSEILVHAVSLIQVPLLSLRNEMPPPAQSEVWMQSNMMGKSGGTKPVVRVNITRNRTVRVREQTSSNRIANGNTMGNEYT